MWIDPKVARASNEAFGFDFFCFFSSSSVFLSPTVAHPFLIVYPSLSASCTFVFLVILPPSFALLLPQNFALR